MTFAEIQDALLAYETNASVLRGSGREPVILWHYGWLKWLLTRLIDAEARAMGAEDNLSHFSTNAITSQCSC